VATDTKNREIRLAQESDVEVIRQIYNHYVRHSTCTYQLIEDTPEERLAWFRAHDDRHPATVFCVSDEVVAWASLSPWNPRGGYDLTAEVSFYVHHDWHRQGIGKALLADLIERAKAIGFHMLIGGASSEQTASIGLQESFGFVPVGTFSQVGRKFDQWLDVIYLQLPLSVD